MARGLVLVVDSDGGACAALRALLMGAGYAVLEAANGREALECFRSIPIDLLVTEVLMADGDGIELITAIRRTGQSVAIIALAQRRFLGRLDLLRLAGSLGADAGLEKPLDAKRLLAAVARLIVPGCAALWPGFNEAGRSPGAPAPPRLRNC